MEVIGHRGQVLAGGPSENTAAAVIAAQAAGADGVEVDVRLTRDRVAVCLHDRDLRRLAGISTPVEQLSDADLGAVLLPSGHRIARLDEIAAASDGLVVAELKHETGCPRALVTAALESLTGAASHRVMVSSCSTAALAEARRLAPSVRLALVSLPGVRAVDGLAHVVAAGHHELHAPAGEVLADPRVAGLARHQRRVLRCWTVNRTRDARRLERAGVTAVITDDPGRMLRARGSSVPLRPVPAAVRATRPRVRVGA